MDPYCSAAIGPTAVPGWFAHPAGGRAFRHALDYREPYCSLSEHEMVELMDCLSAVVVKSATTPHVGAARASAYAIPHGLCDGFELMRPMAP